MDKTSKIIIVALSLALVASVGFIFYENFIRQRQVELQNVYKLGVQDGQVQFLNGLLSQIQTSGFATITFPAANNQTAVLRLAPVPQTQKQ